jgi:carbon-monoxide dehydrogenase large subunit
VVLAISGQEAKKHWKPLPHLVAMMGLKQPNIYALATEKVFYEGEPVAAVAAESRYAAEDALAAIRVEYEELPLVLTIDDSLGGSARPPKCVLYEEWGDNLQLDWQFSYGDVAAAFARADLVLSEEITVQRHSGVPLEARAVLADYDHRRRELTVRMSTQIPHQCRSAFAAIFNLPETQVRVLSGDVGGGFGNKTQMDAEAIPVLLSILTKRPVKWAEKRSDWLMSGPAARDYAHEIEVAFKKDGTLLAVRDRLVGDVGCDGAVRTGGVHSLLVGGIYIPGPYKLQNYEVSVRAFVTNKAPYGPYRGFGKDVANVAMETMLHRAAIALGLDPVEIRQRNLVDEFPYQVCTGPILENGSFRGCLDRLVKEMDLEGLRKRQEQARKEGRFIGIAIASMMEPSGFAGPMSMFSVCSAV